MILTSTLHRVGKQADTLQSQLIQAQQEAGDAKTAADTSIAELQAALADAVARQREPAVRLSNPQARGYRQQTSDDCMPHIY